MDADRAEMMASFLDDDGEVDAQYLCWFDSVLSLISSQ